MDRWFLRTPRSMRPFTLASTFFLTIFLVVLPNNSCSSSSSSNNNKNEVRYFLPLAVGCMSMSGYGYELLATLHYIHHTSYTQQTQLLADLRLIDLIAEIFRKIIGNSIHHRSHQSMRKNDQWCYQLTFHKKRKERAGNSQISDVRG